MGKFRVVLFDVDGVLLDSLASHLKICEDKNREYGLGLKIPDASTFKEIVRSGIRISPMKYFFTAVGFPEEFAEKADLQYQEVFMRKYAPVPFPNVHRTLEQLFESGLVLGIITSNTESNIIAPLSDSTGFFRTDCIFTKDNMRGMTKKDAILFAMDKLEATARETVYIGDQPADWEAAKAADVNFLGVAYGWGISKDDKHFPVVNEVADIYRYVSQGITGSGSNPALRNLS